MDVQGADTVAEAQAIQQHEILPTDPGQGMAPGEVHPDTLPPSGRPEDTAFNPESDEDVPVGEEDLKDAFSRPPAVNSSYLPLPWKGRLGYVSISVMISIASSHYPRPV